MKSTKGRFKEWFDPANKAEADAFSFMLEALLPPEATMAWIAPEGKAEQLLTVSFRNEIIRFAGTPLEGDCFVNWKDYPSAQSLKIFLEKHFRIDSVATEVAALAAYIRRALHEVGMQGGFVVTTEEDKALITHRDDGSFFASCSEDELPKTYTQVQADIEDLLEIKAPESVDTYETFLELLASVNADEFQGAFTFAPFSKHSIEVNYDQGASHRKDKIIRFWLNESFWSSGVTRKKLVETLTDEIGQRGERQDFDYTLFKSSLDRIKADYPNLRMEESAMCIFFLSADHKQFFFGGRQQKINKNVRKRWQMWCQKKGYIYRELDISLLTEAQNLRQFFEDDLGYKCKS